jgi:HTH-type transcriptional repressor of NAD biosynthesis genes
MTHGLVLGTMLVPTVGHQHLLSFAANFVDSVHCIISTRSGEPTSFFDRVDGLDAESNVHFYHHDDDDAPQNPNGENDKAFWAYWANVVRTLVPESIDYVFASELYGQAVADSLKADFIPVDISREVQPVRGTNVRNNLFEQQADIAAEFKRLINLNVVLFGAESCGKTSMARRLAAYFHGTYVPEWARSYLETVGPQVTEHKLEIIVNGQYASERAADVIDTLITVKDTDLLTTLGFYRYNGITQPHQLQWMIRDYPNDLYIVMNDNIKFTPDQLRYGQNKRETDTSFWIRILEEYACEYYVVTSTDRNAQFEEACEAILNHRLTNSGITYNAITTYKRD